jgi:large subunit ribosomal protein L29
MKDSFKELTYKELLTRRDEIKKKYFDLRFQMVIGHVDNPLESRNLRRKVARLNSLISSKDPGVRAK